MKTIRALFSLFLVSSVTIAYSQTADEIVNKHIEAIGGKQVINSIKSQVTLSDLSVMGSTLSSTSTVLVGKGFKNVANFNGQEIIQCITPTTGWSVNPLAGVVDPQRLPEEQVKAAQGALDLGGDLFDYAAKGNKVEYIGTDKVDGKDCYKLKVTTKGGRQLVDYIDRATNYIVKTETSTKVNGEDMTAVSTFADHKKTDIGLVIPYTTTVNQGFEMTITVAKVEFNKEVDPKIFEMPK